MSIIGTSTKPLSRELVQKFEKIMQCNCDLDNWQPEASTGHSWVCRIHKAAIAEARGKA